MMRCVCELELHLCKPTPFYVIVIWTVVTPAALSSEIRIDLFALSFHFCAHFCALYESFYQLFF